MADHGLGTRASVPSPAPPGADVDLGPTLDIVVWVLISLSGLIMGLRLWCKWLRHRGLWWDDYVLISAWLLLLGGGIIGSYDRTLGFGRHIYKVNRANLAALNLNGNIAATFSLLAVVWSKTSFALTMLRLVQGWRMKSLLWFIIISMNIAMYCTTIFTWVRCVPPSKMAQCMDSNTYMAFSIFSGSYSAAMDFLLALLPWPLLWALQMRRKEKFGVAVAMSLGVFAGITAILKCLALPTLAKGDFTFDGAQLIIWGSAEIATTIIAASVPVLRVLILEAKTSTKEYLGLGAKKTTTSSIVQKTRNADTTASRDRNGAGLRINHGSTGAGAGDDRSDKSILDAGSPGANKIVQTNEITLEYSERGVYKDGEGEGWYEMKKVEHAPV